MEKTIVIGLDGADWDLIDPWIQGDVLPNLRYLKESGSWAYSESQLPPVTYPNWKCYSTGKNPGKLGVFYWEYIDRENKQMIIPDSSSFHSQEVFDYISDGDMKVGVINMPTTYPPKKVNGFIIAGGPESSSDNYTFPPELQQQLEQGYDYRVHPRSENYLAIDKSQNLSEQIDDILELIELRFKVARDLLKDLDFLHVTAFYIDVLQHNFYRGDPVKQAWQVIDKNIGDFLNNNYNIILMSDHGFSKIDIVFNINRWLEQENYLALSSEVAFARALYNVGINFDVVVSVAQKIGVHKIIKKIIPEKLKSVLFSSQGKISGRQIIDEASTRQWSGADNQLGRIRTKRFIDSLEWGCTKAVGTKYGLIYLAIDVADPAYGGLREELVMKLENLKDPISGSKIAKKVHRREDVYTGEYLHLAPDLIIEAEEGVHIAVEIGSKGVFDVSNKWVADHRRQGIFLAHGPLIREHQLEDIKILDIAPTICHMLNIAVPEDMDGRVLSEIFREDSIPAKREVQYQEGGKVERSTEERDEEAVRERLRALGYLS